MVLRNAGGDVGTLMASVKKVLKEHPEIKNIKVVVHKDCGAMAVAKDVFEHPRSVSKSVAEKLERFTAEILSLPRPVNMGELRKTLEETINPKLQEESLKGFKGKAGHVDCVGVKEKSHEDHILVVAGKPLTKEVIRELKEKLEKEGRDLSKAYCISGSTSDVTPDIEIAVTRLGLKNVFVLYLSRDDANSIDNMKFFKDAGAKLNNLSPNRDKSVCR